MVVGGPNARTEYHINQTPEYFHQIKGSMTLKVVDEGKFRDITINEGDTFLLPPNTPHNPVRYENTVGIVVEQDRPKDMVDTLRWYCKKCEQIVHEASFHMYDLGTQIKEAIAVFDSDINLRTCKNCGEVATSR